MATYTASGAHSTVQPKGLRVGLVAKQSFFSLTGSLATGDVFQMVRVPKGATPVYMQFGSSNVTPSWLQGVGDDNVNDRFGSMATCSAGQGLLTIYDRKAIPTPYTYSLDDTIDIFVSTVTASNATIGGAFYMNVIFSMDA